MLSAKARQDLILEFWFNGLDDSGVIDKNFPAVRKWFAKDARIDSEIREKFESHLLKANRGEYQDWESSARGRLALIVLFDQFSRNMHRDSPKMFSSDSLALDLTLRSIKDKMDGQMQLIERLFLYMPLMHSEEIKMQRLSLECFENLVYASKEKSPCNTSYYEYSLDFAKRHQAIIGQFGRFPHRNAVLNRLSTPEELEFLTKSGSKF